ncbi:MAG: hypothetical protein K2O28_04140 [Clostridia bacterium]|nr:hypothetical protein [Clostridia bacterium]
MPEPTPVSITEEFRIVEIADGYALQGKIKNNTDEELTIWKNGHISLRVSAVIKDDYSENEREYEFEIFKEKTIIQPKTEYGFFEEISIYKGYTPVKIKTVRGSVAESSAFALYGNVINDGKFAIIALFTGIVGVGLLLITVLCYTTETKNAKVKNNVLQQIKDTLGNGILVTGQFGNKAVNRKATAKTTASFIGAVVSATVFGWGRYTVYGRTYKNDYILTETSIYTFFRNKYNNVTNDIKSALPNPVIAEKKGKIYITGDTKNVFLSVKLSKDKAQNAEILNDLQHIFGTEKL